MGFRVYGLPTLEGAHKLCANEICGWPQHCLLYISCSSGCGELFYYGVFLEGSLKMGLMNLFSL
jgi:hypothetical protein